MAKMKTLTVSGQTYTVCDPEAIRSIDGQKPDEDGNIPVTDDTRAGSLAWSGKHTADKLCPAFSEVGSLVACEPVEGYPLAVISRLAATATPYSTVTLTRCGKNLSQYKSSDESNNSGHMNYYGLRGRSGVTITASADITRQDTTQAENGTMRFYIYYKDGERTTGSATYGAEKNGLPHRKVITLTADASKTVDYLRLIPVDKTVEGDRADNIQLEIGNAATAYAPYKSDTFTVNLEQPAYGGSFDWSTGVLTDENGHTHRLPPQEIPALSGVNVLYSSTGETEVSGKADPITVIEKLTNAIIALGGNI